jgi:hypothetical protein
MKIIKHFIPFFLFFSLSNTILNAQRNSLAAEANQTMLKATKYMVEKVSTHGGYDRVYLPDFSRRWGELEAYKTQIWDGGNIPFTQNMGELFLNAYEATGNEYYYQAAEGVAKAFIWGQLPSGGWDHIIDFAGDRSLKEWYKTIGRNAWGWDEYNHYYGTATYKQNSTVSIARFLLRLYFEKFDPIFKPALDKAINFILISQYPLGGWPQRYPQKIDRQYSFGVGENSEYYGNGSEYTGFYSFNDGITSDNIQFLIQCYITLGEERFLDPIMRGMNFYLITQQGNPQGGWADQYNMELKPSHGRQYEPAALVPGDTYRICMLLMEFYKYTGDRKFLARIPDAIKWIKSTQLPKDETDGGKYTNPIFVEIGTNKAIYAHRKGTGVNHGHYWIDYSDSNPLLHYGAKENLNIERLKEEYRKVSALSPEEATKDSPLKAGRYQGDKTPQDYFDLNASLAAAKAPNESEVKAIIGSLDNQNRWLSKHAWISHPYTVSKTGEESNTAALSTEGGAQIRDSSDQEYISTEVYIENMGLLIDYIMKQREIAKDH